MEVQGHRGARGLKPESTLQAFETALDLMVDTLELDCHLTADDQILVWHDEGLWDEKVRRVDSSAPELPVRIRSLHSRFLHNYLADQNPDTKRFPIQESEPTALAGDEYLLTTLRYLFDFVASYADWDEKPAAQQENARTVQFNIETKRVEAHPEYIGDGFDGEQVSTFEVGIIDAMDAAGVTGRSTIQSFDFRSLRAIQRFRPDIRLSALSEFVPDFSELVAFGASIWSPYYLLLTSANVAQAHDHGLEVMPWTVNETHEMQSLIEMGVDGFITDRPDLGMALKRTSSG